MVSNYRPISLLLLLSKLFEKIVHKQLYNYLVQWNLLDDRQGVFGPGHSTVKTFSQMIYTLPTTIMKRP